jgi:hypothetical protein
VNLTRLRLPAIKLWAYDHLCLFGWPVPLAVRDDRFFIYRSPMETLESHLNEEARIAEHIEQVTGCPAKLLIAQWAIESKWGEEPVGHANYLGIKHLTSVQPSWRPHQRLR